MSFVPSPRTTRRACLAMTTAVLAVALAMPVTASAGGLNVGGTGASLGGMRHLAEAFTARHPDTPVEVVEGLGSTGGVKAMLAGVLDIALAGRDLREAEREAEREAGASARPYAQTPFLLATDLDNDVDGVTLDDLAGILRGDVTTWPDGSPIRLVLRPKADSDSALLASLSPEMPAALEAAHGRPGLTVATTDQDAAEAIATLPGSLGTSTLALIRAEDRPLKMLALDGVAPTPANLERGAYPLYKTFSVVTRAEVADDAQAFIDFVWSDEGRAILARTGHLWIGDAPGV